MADLGHSALVGLMYVSHKFATGSKMSELVVLDLFSGSVASDDDAGAAAVEKGRRSKARDCVASVRATNNLTVLSLLVSKRRR